MTTYALGVVVGAPVIAILGVRLPRRGLLVAATVVGVPMGTWIGQQLGWRTTYGARSRRLPC